MISRFRMTRKPLLILLVFSLVCSFAGLSNASASSDLSGHWAAGIIEQWQQDRLVNGYPDGSFAA